MQYLKDKSWVQGVVLDQGPVNRSPKAQVPGPIVWSPWTKPMTRKKTRKEPRDRSSKKKLTILTPKVRATKVTLKNVAVLEAVVHVQRADLEVAHGLHVKGGPVRVLQDEAEDHEAVVDRDRDLIRQDVAAAIVIANGLLRTRETMKRGTDSTLRI